MPYSTERDAIKEYYTAEMNFDRDVERVTPKTWEDHESTHNMYLGYARRYHTLRLEDLTLELFTNAWLWVGFMRFMVQRCSSPTSYAHITSVVSHSRRVLEWLCVKYDDDDAKVGVQAIVAHITVKVVCECV